MSRAQVHRFPRISVLTIVWLSLWLAWTAVLNFPQVVSVEYFQEVIRLHEAEMQAMDSTRGVSTSLANYAVHTGWPVTYMWQTFAPGDPGVARSWSAGLALANVTLSLCVMAGIIYCGRRLRISLRTLFVLTAALAILVTLAKALAGVVGFWFVWTLMVTVYFSPLAGALFFIGWRRRVL